MYQVVWNCGGVLQNTFCYCKEGAGWQIPTHPPGRRWSSAVSQIRQSCRGSFTLRDLTELLPLLWGWPKGLDVDVLWLANLDFSILFICQKVTCRPRRRRTLPTRQPRRRRQHGRVAVATPWRWPNPLHTALSLGKHNENVRGKVWIKDELFEGHFVCRSLAAWVILH